MSFRGKLRIVEGGRFSFRCPGCGLYHGIKTGPEGWGWNGSYDAPTFTPSLLVTLEYGEARAPVRCHSFITDGAWRFLDDCTHALAGKVVPMEEETDA